jgi:hypothetical protein
MKNTDYVSAACNIEQNVGRMHLEYPVVSEPNKKPKAGPTE